MGARWQGARCRSCGAPIIWARTEAGKPMPVDADPIDGGNVLLVATGTATPIARSHPAVDPRIDGLAVEAAPRHTSHFATCPQAGKWRRKP